ncbi:MAG: leucyl aminopeptidase [Pseudomonadota bacterium]
MSNPLSFDFVAFEDECAAVTALVVGADLTMGPQAKALNERSGGQLLKAAAAASFTGAKGSSLDVYAAGDELPRHIILLGAGKLATYEALDWKKLGGRAFQALSKGKAETSTLILDMDIEGEAGERSACAAAVAQGMSLRAYKFTKYRTAAAERAKADEGDAKPDSDKTKLTSVRVQCADPADTATAHATFDAVSAGVYLARDLVNEPANALGPSDFAARVRDEVGEAGCQITVLDEAALEGEDMIALLAVGMGSARESQAVVMTWQGADDPEAAPVCFIGKGVVFDTGGISMKPAGGMEDMKGDMAGAACVAGLMKALALRKAKVNAVGLIGLVENMPSGSAMRPGDIIGSKSGQTIEVLNTDAEGRLVLADLLTYAQAHHAPRFMVDLATLTGAIMVALGKEHAGLFSNNDELAGALNQSGEATGETVWRMPLGAAYNKLIDSKNADMKNIGGRWGGSITAAQFLQRFVDDVPWAHLDIAGTGMNSGQNALNQSWGSGWGVRLLDHMVAAHYEGVDEAS